MSNEIKVYDNNEYVGTVHVFQDESGTELNSVVEIDGDVYHEPLSPFCYISDKQLTMTQVQEFIEVNKQEVIQALKDVMQ